MQKEEFEKSVDKVHSVEYGIETTFAWLNPVKIQLGEKSGKNTLVERCAARLHSLVGLRTSLLGKCTR